MIARKSVGNQVREWRRTAEGIKKIRVILQKKGRKGRWTNPQKKSGIVSHSDGETALLLG